MDLTIIAGFALFGMLGILAGAIAVRRNLLVSAICLSVFSLISASLFLLMEAPDVAITEAAIGSAISLLFYLAAFRVLGVQETERRKLLWPSLAGCIILFAGLVWAISDMPQYGDAESPANVYLGKYYINNAMADTGVPNAVTAVLASYRGFDTLGETYVILAAMIAILLIIPNGREGRKEP